MPPRFFLPEIAKKAEKCVSQWDAFPNNLAQEVIFHNLRSILKRRKKKTKRASWELSLSGLTDALRLALCTAETPCSAHYIISGRCYWNSLCFKTYNGWWHMCRMTRTSLCSASWKEMMTQRKEQERAKRTLEKQKRRITDLDAIIQRLHEDNICQGSFFKFKRKTRACVRLSNVCSYLFLTLLKLFSSFWRSRTSRIMLIIQSPLQIYCNDNNQRFTLF